MYYHSIDDEVPGPNQRMVRLGYAAWILVATGYCLNFLVLSVAFFGKGGSTTVATWFFALLVSAAGLPARGRSGTRRCIAQRKRRRASWHTPASSYT